MGRQLEGCHSEGCFAISFLNVTVLFLILGLSMEPPRLLSYYFLATVIVLLSLVWVFFVALANLLTATK